MTDPIPLFTIADEISADIDQVWAIISNFGGLRAWSAAVDSCVTTGSGIGALRHVDVGGTTIIERLEASDPEAHTITYRPISGSTLPIANMLVTMALSPLGLRRTCLVWTVFGHPTIDPAKAHDILAKRYGVRIGELKQCLRNGPSHSS